MVNRRFQREISGELDREVASRTGRPNNHYWQKEAEKQVQKTIDMYNNGELLIDEYGVAYWASNNRAIPEEYAIYAEYAGLPVNCKLTREMELNQMKKSLEEYRERMKNHVYTEEELGEMRNAFGEGKTIVDVITGKKINTGFWKRQ